MYRPLTISRTITILATALVLKVAVAVVLSYGSYFPPNFSAGFLLGRANYFWGAYSAAFYAHIVAGPVTLVLGLLLISDAFRRRFARWHRRLGRVQGSLVLLLVAPSGLWMATRAEAGAIAGLGFGTLAIATLFCTAMGWRTAIARRFAEHRRWMWRGYLLLCSAVVIRMIGGLATVIGFYATWLDPAAAWVSWLLPLAVFELLVSTKSRQLLARTTNRPSTKNNSNG
jgi:hypothetical protein